MKNRIVRLSLTRARLRFRSGKKCWRVGLRILSGNTSVSETNRFDLNRILLVFKRADIERDFVARSYTSSIFFIRLYLLAAAALYAMFGILDATISEQYRPLLWTIRYGFAVPIMLVVFALTFARGFSRFVQPALSAAMCAGGLGVVFMTAVLPAPYNSQYYAGLIMVVIYSGSLLGLRFTYSMFITISLVASYQLVGLYINPISAADYISNNFFLGMATGVGLFCSYILETHIRSNYVAQKVIEEKNQAMQVLLDEAEAANRAKSEFLATMSHELRTPLNAIIGFSEMIRREYMGPVGSAKYIEYAGDINDSGQHLLSIISDILDLAKAESGKLELNESEFDFSDVVKSTLKMFSRGAEEAGVELVFVQSPEHYLVRGDERLMRQVALNLVSNALKFTPAGGTISIEVAVSHARGASLVVRDSGIGIAPENLDRVLRPFEQVESSLSRSHGGTGLGLPYSKKVVEIHGGKLTLSSVMRRGTTVSVQLPSTRVIAGEASRLPRELMAAG